MSILTVTTVGKAKILDALHNGVPVPAIEAISYSDDVPPADPATYKDITDIGNEVYRGNVILVDRVSPEVMHISGDTPVDRAFRIRNVKIIDSQNDVIAYTPYMPEDDGFYKGAGLAWEVKLTLSQEEGNAEITFNYSPLDIVSVTNQIVTDAQTQMDLYLQAHLLEQIKLLSSQGLTLIRNIMEVNKLKQIQGLI